MSLAEVCVQAILRLPDTARCAGASQRLRLHPVFSELCYFHVEAVEESLPRAACYSPAIARKESGKGVIGPQTPCTTGSEV